MNFDLDLVFNFFDLGLIAWFNHVYLYYVIAVIILAAIGIKENKT